MNGQVLEMPDSRRRRLKELETVIESGWAGVVQMGQALREIRDEGLYLELDEGLTFEQYCKTRWALPERTAYQRIDMADVADATCAIAQALPIPTEAVGRELAPLLRIGGPEQVAEAWAKVSEKYAGQRPPTASEVHRVLVAEGYRPRIGQASSGSTNSRVYLGQVGDRIASTEKRLDWFLTRDMSSRKTTPLLAKQAVDYAERCERLASLLRDFAGGAK